MGLSKLGEGPATMQAAEGRPPASANSFTCWSKLSRNARLATKPCSPLAGGSSLCSIWTSGFVFFRPQLGSCVSEHANPAWPIWPMSTCNHNRFIVVLAVDDGLEPPPIHPRFQHPVQVVREALQDIGTDSGKTRCTPLVVTAAAVECRSASIVIQISNPHDRDLA